MPLRVVVFDDDDSMRRILAFVCERRGYEVFAFLDPGVCPLHGIPAARRRAVPEAEQGVACADQMAGVA